MTKYEKKAPKKYMNVIRKILLAGLAYKNKKNVRFCPPNTYLDLLDFDHHK